MESGELRPDFGPDLPHRNAGATLVTARPPLAAFNIELDTGDTEIARAVAAGLREAGGGPPGVRAIGLLLSNGRAQVSTNVHDPLAVPLGEVVERVRQLAAPLGTRPLEAELVGLIPRGALADYPADVPIRGFDPHRHTIEARLAEATD
jgi:glutamate formiminotransferase